MIKQKMMNKKITIKNVSGLISIIILVFIFNMKSFGQSLVIVSGGDPCGVHNINGTYNYGGVMENGGHVYIDLSSGWLGQKSIQYRYGKWNIMVFLNYQYVVMFENTTGTLPFAPATGWVATSQCPNAIPPTLYDPSFPVELSSFEGEQKINGVELKWITNSENDNQGFGIEHSMDGREWQEIAFVDGNGTSSEKIEYSYSHANTKSGPNYYRLVQRDYDGMYEYSEVIRVMVDAKDGVVIYPNPAHDILYLRGLEQEVNYNVYNISGVLVMSGLTEETINILDLESGIYIIEILEHNEPVKSRFVKY